MEWKYGHCGKINCVPEQKVIIEAESDEPRGYHRFFYVPANAAFYRQRGGGGNIWELDEFLMMFGKHWVKAVPTSRSRVAPAVSKEYDWTSFSSKMFGIADQLCSNADLLFALLLQFNESNMISGKDTFTNR